MTTHVPNSAVSSTMTVNPGSSTNKVLLLDSGSYPAFSNYGNQSWTFNGTTPDWTNLSSSFVNSNGPLPVRINACSSYDGNNILLFSGQGGSSAQGILSDSWVFNSTSQTWSQQTGLTVSPFGRYNAEMALLNDASPGVIMFGGANLLYNLLETWQWVSTSTSGVWSQISVANGKGPSARVGHCFAGQSSTSPGLCVLFGGNGTNSQYNDTWHYTTLAGWVQQNPTTVPSVRSNATFSYDPVNSIYVMHGGENAYGFINESWTYASGSATWTKVSIPAGTGPGGRINAQQCFDSVSGKTILFGGICATTDYPDMTTWSFNGSTLVWSQL